MLESAKFHIETYREAVQKGFKISVMLDGLRFTYPNSDVIHTVKTDREYAILISDIINSKY